MNEQFTVWLVMRILHDVTGQPKSVVDDYPNAGRWTYSVAKVRNTQDSSVHAFVRDALDDLGAGVNQTVVLRSMESVPRSPSSTISAWFNELLHVVIKNTLSDERASRLFEVWDVCVDDVEADPAGTYEWPPDSLAEPPDIEVSLPPTMAAEDSQITDECERFNRLQERREAELIEKMRRWASETCDKLRKSSGDS